MKFRFLLIGLLVIFSTVGSYAQDYVSFDITSVTLTENNWGDAGDNSAELMVIAISESYSGKRTKLTIPSEGSISASLNSRISTEEYAGLHIPISKDIVRVYLFAFDADQINSALSIAGDAFIKLTTKMIATNAWKYFKKFKKSNFYSLVAGEAIGYGYDKAKEYIEENDDLGRAVIEIHKKRIPNGEQVVYAIEKGVKFTYKIKLEHDNSSSSSQSSTQSKPNIKKVVSSEKSKYRYLFYGIRQNNHWNKKYFKILNRNSNSIPKIGDYIQALSSVTKRSFYIQNINNQWINAKGKGSTHKGDVFEVKEVREVYPNYFWIKY